MIESYSMEGREEHRCTWREVAEQQELRLNELAKLVAEQQTILGEQQALIAQRDAQGASLEAKVNALEARLLGKSSERVQPVDRELAAELTEEEKQKRRKEAERKRRERAAARDARMRTEEHVHLVPEEQKVCPECGGTNEAFSEVGFKGPTFTYEYVPGHFVRRRHLWQTVRCRCGEHLVTAPPPPRPFERTIYEAGFVAWVIVAKCADSIPVHRLYKRLSRQGIDISRSTMNDLVHRAATELAPLANRLRWRIAKLPIVLADETSFRLADRDKRGFVWVFHGWDDTTGRELVGYVFATDRSGETPARILGGTSGTLLVDGYTGYNVVTDPDGRERAGCMGHLRRKVYAARESAPADAQHALDEIRELFRVEATAFDSGIVRTDAHLQLRLERSAPVMERLHAFFEQKKDEHLPKSPLGTAIGYATRQWPRLSLFLTDARIPLHNNSSERRLRVQAIGRHNFLFFGNPVAGRHFADLYSLVQTCDACGVEPTAYLADVMCRVRDATTTDELDALLPDRWTPRPAPDD